MEPGREGWASVDNWMARVGPATRPKYRYHFERFMAWMPENGQGFRDFTPDQLIEFQQDSEKKDRYEILDLVQSWVLTSYRGRTSYKRRAYAVVRSFFMHNRAELPSDSNFKVRGDLAKTIGELGPSDVKDVVLSSSPIYQAIFLCMGMGFMDEAAFDYWNLNGWPKLEGAMRKGSDVIRIDQPGRKEELNEVPYYKLIAGDSLDALKKYLAMRPAGSSAIFMGSHGDPVSKVAVYRYWHRHLRKLGKIPAPQRQQTGAPRYGKNPHEIRDVFRSLWTKSPAKYELGEFFMGHIERLDPNLYDKSYNDEAWARSEYRKALPWLNVMSSPLPHGQVEISDMEKLARENQALRKQLEAMEARLSRVEEGPTITFTDEQIQRLRNAKLLISYEEVEKIRKAGS